MTTARPFLLALGLALSATRLAGQEPAPAQWDPTTIDPSPIDANFPPALSPVTIASGGGTVRGHFYLADGPGPHPTVILLRDLPGYERNGDVAQAIRRAGYNVLLVDYRGTWGSAGEFSWEGAVEDAEAAISFAASEAAVGGYRTDPARIHLLAEGFGSWVALRAALAHPVVECIATVGAWNPGVRGRQMAMGEDAAAVWRQSFLDAVDPAGGPIRASDPDDLLGRLADEPSRYELTRSAMAAQDNPVLLVVGSDSETDPARQTVVVAASLSAAGARSVERVILNGDHTFSSVRVRLARTVVGWLERRCPAW